MTAAMDPPPRTPAPLWKKLFLAAVSVLVCLVVVEVALRVRYLGEFRDVTGDEAMFVRSANPGLVYELRPSYAKVNPTTGVLWETNADGFRDREFTPKPPGRFRIVAVGDSVTIGWAQRPEETYPKVLERRLTSTGDDVDVLNLGTSGYNALQEAELIRSRTLDYAPDLILIAYVLNDNIAWGGGELTRAFRYSGCMVCDQLRMRSARLKYALGRDLVTVAFGEVAQFSRRHEIPVLVVVFPYLETDRNGAYPHQSQHDHVVDVASRCGFLVLDLLDRFQAAGLRELRNSPEDITHPNARGYELAAEAIADFLQQHAGKIGLDRSP